MARPPSDLDKLLKAQRHYRGTTQPKPHKQEAIIRGCYGSRLINELTSAPPCPSLNTGKRPTILWG